MREEKIQQRITTSQIMEHQAMFLLERDRYTVWKSLGSGGYANVSLV